MNRIKHMILLAACLLGAACAASPEKLARMKPVDEINNERGLALKGFDPVAYFTDGKPSAGNAAITYQWQGATYRFATEEHRDAFKASPEHFAPQFGGYCAFAVSQGTTADGDPFQWALVDDKLYVNNNAFAAGLWNRDRPGHIEAGNSNWPIIPKQPLPTAGSR